MQMKLVYLFSADEYIEEFRVRVDETPSDMIARAAVSIIEGAVVDNKQWDCLGRHPFWMKMLPAIVLAALHQKTLNICPGFAIKEVLVEFCRGRGIDLPGTILDDIADRYFVFGIDMITPYLGDVLEDSVWTTEMGSGVWINTVRAELLSPSMRSLERSYRIAGVGDDFDSIRDSMAYRGWQ